jgi:formylglycine-generating enzyme required for sulfatase activity
MKLLAGMIVGLLVCVPLHADDTLENFLGMQFVRIPAGEFLMGTPQLEAALMEVPEPKPGELEDETPAHRVVISSPFYIGQTEVTQKHWLRVMENRPGPEARWNRDDWGSLPVGSVSWFMAQRFVEEINQMDSKFRYRLPTEAEWEYVARAGSESLRPVSLENLEEHAWFINNSDDVVHPVATRRPNQFGIHDMLGNVWEWTADWYSPDAYTASMRTDPDGPDSGRFRVRRGGSYHCPLHLVRPGYRSADKPGTTYDVVGFRLIAEPR